MNQFILHGLEESLISERKRLVGLCTTLTGNAQVAEDLAQEVMLEAWRSIEKLQDRERFSQWLSGIARNVCLRWGRKQGRQVAEVDWQATDNDITLEEQLMDDFDLEVELERRELVELLDRALAELPVETRQALVARYVEGSSLAEVAERLGMQTGAVAMRLNRGKLALRRLLKEGEHTELFGCDIRSTDELVQTAVWCTLCGLHRLQGVFKPEQGILRLRCPACGEYSHSHLGHTSEFALFHGIKRVRPALTRLNKWINRYYGNRLNAMEAAPCLHCGKPASFRYITSLREVQVSHFAEGWKDGRGIYQICPYCQIHNWTSLHGLVLALPEGQQFLQQHPRMHVLPEQEIEVDGCAAVVTRFESVTDAARFEVVSTKERYQTLRIDGRHS